MTRHDTEGGGYNPEMETASTELRDPDHNFPIQEELKDVTADEVLEVAHGITSRVMKRIRKQRDVITTRDEFVKFPLPVMGEPGRVNSLISLSTPGCMDAHVGDCTFCDYGHSELPKKEVLASLPRQIDEAFALIAQENEGYERLFINFTAIGSMFDDREMPPEYRKEVYKRIAEMVNSGKFPQGAEWTTESRLRYVTREKLEEMRDEFARYGIEIGHDKDLEVDIGYGLESSDPLIVEGAMGKQVAVPHRESTELLREFGVKATAHTLFKPPFLTEREAVEDAVRTVEYAFDNDLCDLMIVMTMNKRDATLVGELAEQGMYQLPSIWSVAEIMKRLGPERCKKSHFFGFSVATEAADTVTPKDEDERELMQKILAFAGEPSEWQEIMDFVAAAKSSAKAEWEQLMAYTPADTLQARIASGLDVVARKYLGKGFTELAEEIRTKRVDVPEQSGGAKIGLDKLSIGVPKKE